MLNVLFVTAEAHPLAKTGGLGDVCGALPPALQALGADLRLLLPAYPQAKRVAGALRAIAQIPLAFSDVPATLLEGVLPGSDVVLWLVDHPGAFAREGDPYLDASGAPWLDNAQRFAVLCTAAAALADTSTNVNWRPDIVHCHDWQTGLVPALLASHAKRPATVFTIHNLAYQGLFPAATFTLLRLPPALWSTEGLEFYGQVSFIKGGLVYADQLSTVSPTYAREIQTPAFGAGCDGLLRHRADRLSGILNGIDTDTWNPANDAHLAQRYSARSLARKQANKLALQKQMLLPSKADRPLLGMIGRLVEQKGFDLALDAWPQLAARDVQLVLLGTGERALEQAWRDMQRRYPDQLAVHIGYDEALAHRIEGGADMFLMPSRFEPCGLNQMYSQRYGTVPIVHRVGGLADTVTEAPPQTPAATGFAFDDEAPAALAAAVTRALAVYADKAQWRTLALNGMRQDFSWQKSAQEYFALYRRACERHYT